MKWMSFDPQLACDDSGIDSGRAPPVHFKTSAVNLAMMSAAKRYGELVAYFEAERSGLGKPQVMRIGWLPAADQAGLRGHESQVGLVAKTLGLGDGQNALIDLSGKEAG